MTQTIAIITPAFRAERWIARCARSVLAQSNGDWEHWIVADDGADYEAILAAAGARDPRQHFAATGAVGRGSSAARNVALDAIATPDAALLAADDRFAPEKLARVVPLLATHGIVSTAIAEFDEAGRALRQVGTGADHALVPGAYKWTCLSMDSMIAWNRRVTDGRCDLTLGAMTDLSLLLELFRTVPATWHIGTPLHHYIKTATSVSNGPGVTARMVAAKRELIRRLESGRYPMADARGPAGLARFLALSLTAEETYEQALAARPGLLFEDHLEPILAANPPQP